MLDFLNASEFFQLTKTQTVETKNSIWIRYLICSNYVPRVEINVQVIEDEEDDEVDDEEDGNDEENDVRNWRLWKVDECYK